MSALPRLPIPVERRLLRAMCGLPPRPLRSLFGAPPQIDGQVLAGEVHALLGVLRAAGTTSLIDGMSVTKAREELRRGAATTARAMPIQMDLLARDAGRRIAARRSSLRAGGPGA